MQNGRHYRRMPLAGGLNVRDLGGYPCAGGATRWGVFIRSDSPAGFTQSDVEALLAYGVTTAIDLRSAEERERNPSCLEANGAFGCHHISLSDQMHAVNFEGDVPGSMSGLYISLLDNNKAAIAGIFARLAEAEGGVIFHCTVGKDRTGVVSMLLLKLAGVADPDVVADYAVSEIYMQEFFDTTLKNLHFGREIPAHVTRSLPDSMRRVLRHLDETYGGAESYLLAAGLPAEALAALKGRFIEP